MSDDEKRKQDFENFFREADVNNDQTVSIHELRDILRKKCGEKMSDGELAAMCSNLDSDGDMKITLEEFLTAMLKKPRRKAFEDTFRELDTDHTGKLRRDQISTFCQKLSGVGNEAEIQRMFDEVDVNGDGVISFDEFMALV